MFAFEYIVKSTKKSPHWSAPSPLLAVPGFLKCLVKLPLSKMTQGINSEKVISLLANVICNPRPRFVVIYRTVKFLHHFTIMISLAFLNLKSNLTHILNKNTNKKYDIEQQIILSSVEINHEAV